MQNEPEPLHVAFEVLRQTMLSGAAGKIYKEQAEALLARDHQLRAALDKIEALAQSYAYKPPEAGFPERLVVFAATVHQIATEAAVSHKPPEKTQPYIIGGEDAK
jgi:hypothetical protein